MTMRRLSAGWAAGSAFPSYNSRRLVTVWTPGWGTFGHGFSGGCWVSCEGYFGSTTCSRPELGGPEGPKPSKALLVGCEERGCSVTPT